MQKMQRTQSHMMKQKPLITPQSNIYNRHFYLRGAEHQLRQTQYQNEIKQLANKPKITISSYNILCQQLQRKMLQLFTKEHLQKNTTQDFVLEKAQVDFMQLQSIVCELCQIQQDKVGLELEHFLSQLWLVLGEYQIKSQISANYLYTTFRIFFDPYNLNIKECLDMLIHLPQFKNSDQNRIKFLREYPQLKDQTLTVQQIIKLWRKIRYNNPAFTKITSKIDQNAYKYTYKPEINQRSQQLASKSLQKYLTTHHAYLNRTVDHNKTNENTAQEENNQLSSYLSGVEINENSKYYSKPSTHDILYRRKLEKDSLAPKILNKQDSCDTSRISKVTRTARPQQIKEIVDNLYVVKPRQEDTNFSKIDQQKQLKLCTFSPKINRSYSSKALGRGKDVKGYDKQVNRLQKGRQQKQKKKQAYENLGRVKNFTRNYSKSPNRSIAPSFIERDAPKLILQINIDGDRVQKLALKGDQDPHLVSKKFVIKHGLQSQMIQVLEALVEQQLRNL